MQALALAFLNAFVNKQKQNHSKACNAIKKQKMIHREDSGTRRVQIYRKL